MNRHYERAATLAEKQLRIIDYIGVEDFIRTGIMQGMIEEFDPPYLWEVETELMDIDNLYMVTVTVSWVEYNRRYSVSVDTRINGVGNIVELESEESGN